LRQKGKAGITKRILPWAPRGGGGVRAASKGSFISFSRECREEDNAGWNPHKKKIVHPIYSPLGRRGGERGLTERGARKKREKKGEQALPLVAGEGASSSGFTNGGERRRKKKGFLGRLSARGAGGGWPWGAMDKAMLCSLGLIERGQRMERSGRFLPILWEGGGNSLGKKGES